MQHRRLSAALFLALCGSALPTEASTPVSVNPNTASHATRGGAASSRPVIEFKSAAHFTATAFDHRRALLVTFFSPFKRHSRQTADALSEVGEIMDNTAADWLPAERDVHDTVGHHVIVGKVDATQFPDVAANFSALQLPTTLLFVFGRDPVRVVQDVVVGRQAVARFVEDQIHLRFMHLQIKALKKANLVRRGHETATAGADQRRSAPAAHPSPGTVMQLSEGTFSSLALDAHKVAVVAFVGADCAHSIGLLSTLRTLASVSETLVDVMIGSVNIATSPELAERFDVLETPTIIVFPKGVADGTVEEKAVARGLRYEGRRTLQHLKALVDLHRHAPDVSVAHEGAHMHGLGEAMLFDDDVHGKATPERVMEEE